MNKESSYISEGGCLKIHEYKELEDGGTDLETELTIEEACRLTKIALTKVLGDFVEEHEKQFEDRVEDVWEDYKDDEDL